MADLRERLRAIESTAPPDLWAEIEARARDDRPETGGATVTAFRSRRSEWGRRVATVAVAAAVFVLGSVLLWQGLRPQPPVPRPASDVPVGWERCTNHVEGYSIGFPADWFSTDVLNGERDLAYACRWFDTQPFGQEGNVVSEGFAYPLEVGVRAGPFDTVVADESKGGVQVLLREDTSLGGRRAVRLALEFLDGPLVPAGTRVYEYIVELGPGRTLRILTADQSGIAGTYDDNRTVVDQAVSTVRLAEE